jgi:hypothetical protein
MTDQARTEAKALIHAHKHAMDDLHHKLAAIPGVDKVKLRVATEKVKLAHATFEEDALECIVH